ncbi:MAG: hypothetical protein HRT45_15990 [Bdellovibrionales bacterium]|nr:hypothetical protein [Bdellovibrionales bacterium]
MWIKNSSLEVEVVFFENTTTHVVHLEEGDSSKVSAFEVSQILEGQLKVRAPKTACVIGHQIDIVVEARTKTNEWKFRSRAKVTEHEKLNEEEAEVVIDLHNKNDIDYERFMQVFESLQDEVSQLFNAIKGN